MTRTPSVWLTEEWVFLGLSLTYVEPRIIFSQSERDGVGSWMLGLDTNNTLSVLEESLGSVRKEEILSKLTVFEILSSDMHLQILRFMSTCSIRIVTFSSNLRRFTKSMAPSFKLQGAIKMTRTVSKYLSSFAILFSLKTSNKTGWKAGMTLSVNSSKR